MSFELHEALKRVDSELTARGSALYLSLSAPLVALVLRSRVQGIDQQATQLIAAFKVGADNFEPDLIDAGAAKQHVRLNPGAHTQRDLEIGFTADTKVVFLRPHATAEAQFTDHDNGLAPRTSDRPRHGFRQDQTLIAALA